MGRTALPQRRLPQLDIPFSVFFNGVDEDINFGNILSKERTDSFSFSFYVKLIPTGGVHTILGKRTGGNAGYDLFYLDTAVAPFHSLRMFFDGANGSNLAVDSPPIDRNKWVHVVMAYGGTSTPEGIDFYFNAVLQTNTTALTGLNDSIVNAISFICGVKSDNSSDMTGGLTRLRAHTSRLTQAQVDDLYFCGISINLEHEWLFNDGSGTELEDSVGGANGTIDATWSLDSPTKVRISPGAGTTNSVEFDIVGDYIAATSTSLGTFGDGVSDTPFSTMVRVKHLGLGSGNQGLISKDRTGQREWALFTVGTTNVVRLFLKDPLSGANQQSIDSTTVLVPGRWYDIIASYDGRGGADAADGLTISINGLEEVPTNIVKGTYTAMHAGTAPVEVGRFASDPNNELLGRVAEAVIWPSELTAIQKAKLSRNIYPANVTTLHWKMDEDTGTTVADSSGNGNTGNFVGDPQWSDDNPRPAGIKSGVGQARSSVT